MAKGAVFMLAVGQKEFGAADVLHLTEVHTPEPGAGELLVRIRATALNRADLLQRRGLYPPPAGASEILGLEMAGEVVACGPQTSGAVHIGDRVAALLPGGGYAQYCVIPEGMAIPIPDTLSFDEAAGLPEAFLTAYLNLFLLGRLKPSETVLVHAGASGVGTSALQLIREVGARAVVTAGSTAKINRCLDLGAVAGWNYKDGSFLPFVKEQTDNRGVDIIMDFVGAPYFADNIASLAMDGRVIVIGTMGGAEVEHVNLGLLLRNRLSVIGTALRARTDKESITAAFLAQFGDALKEGRVKPIIDRVFPWAAVATAHRYMESNANTGKIVLAVD